MLMANDPTHEDFYFMYTVEKGELNPTFEKFPNAMDFGIQREHVHHGRLGYGHRVDLVWA